MKGHPRGHCLDEWMAEMEFTELYMYNKIVYYLFILQAKTLIENYSTVTNLLRSTSKCPWHENWDLVIKSITTLAYYYNTSWNLTSLL